MKNMFKDELTEFFEDTQKLGNETIDKAFAIGYNAGLEKAVEIVEKQRQSKEETGVGFIDMPYFLELLIAAIKKEMK